MNKTIWTPSYTSFDNKFVGSFLYQLLIIVAEKKKKKKKIFVFGKDPSLPATDYRYRMQNSSESNIGLASDVLLM